MKLRPSFYEIIVGPKRIYNRTGLESYRKALLTQPLQQPLRTRMVQRASTDDFDILAVQLVRDAINLSPSKVYSKRIHFPPKHLLKMRKGLDR